jgi:pimeloyl-ACP methyl ester carboxylesterase
MSTDPDRSAAAGAAEAVQQVRAAAGAVVGDMAGGRWRRAGVLGISLGVVAAGAVAGVAVERLTVGREVRRRARAEVDAAAPFGSLRGIPYPVTAADGTRLYVELDGTGWTGTPYAKGRPDPAEPDPAAPNPAGPNPAAPDQAAPDQAGPNPAAPDQAAPDQAGPGAVPGSDAAPAPEPAPEPGGGGRRGWLGRFLPSVPGVAAVRTGQLGEALSNGVLSSAVLSGTVGTVGGWLGLTTGPPLTVVLCHGYCLNQDSWHFQRAAFQDGLRLVLWDQRSHGRSERGRSGAAGQPVGIDQLGGDLKAVIDAVAPTGPLVLVGHSMGGMTVMALADQYPELIRERVAGVAFIGTTAGGWSGNSLGLPAYGAKVLHWAAPGVLRALGKQAELVERTRRLGSDLTSSLYRRYSFGSDQVDPAVERFAQRMLEATPIDVVAEFYPAFYLHEKVAALAAFREVPTLVLVGSEDLLTPPSHSEAIAAELPDAELVVVPEAGHLVLLERPELVNAWLAWLLEQAARRSGAALPQSVRETAATLTDTGRAAPDAAPDPSPDTSPDPDPDPEARA